MSCSGCFSDSRQRREALRIIIDKATYYAKQMQQDMAIYEIEGEIKFDLLTNRIGKTYFQIITYKAGA